MGKIVKISITNHSEEQIEIREKFEFIPINRLAAINIIDCPPYLLLTRLDVSNRIFLEEVLPELFQDVAIAIRNRLWFQNDVVSAHFSTFVRNNLDNTFGAR